MGVRDIFVLPGEMKDLMNKVAGAKKAAEANLIVLREVKAAMRTAMRGVTSTGSSRNGDARAK
jgi:hypothetical protein